MIGHNHFRYGGHAHCIAAYNTEKLILGRSFKCGTGDTDIHTVHYTYALLCGNFIGKADKLMTVGLGHCRKTGTEFVVIFTTQRIFGKQIDMIGDDHYIAYAELLVHTPGSIADKECLHTESFHNPYRKCNGLHVVAFIIMETSLHGHYRLGAKTTEYQIAAVPLYGRYREIGNLTVRYVLFVFDMVNQSSQPGAQDYGGIRHCAYFAADIIGCFLNFD